MVHIQPPAKVQKAKNDACKQLLLASMREYLMTILAKSTYRFFSYLGLSVCDNHQRLRELVVCRFASWGGIISGLARRCRKHQQPYGIHDKCDVYRSLVPCFVGINGDVFEYLAVWPLACLNVQRCLNIQRYGYFMFECLRPALFEMSSGAGTCLKVSVFEYLAAIR